MKKFLIILISTLLATAAGLYFRPSFALIGQLDWYNVLTKGYFVGSFQQLFTQGMIDESFMFVICFTAGGLVMGIVIALMMVGKKSAGKSKSKK